MRHSKLVVTVKSFIRGKALGSLALASLVPVLYIPYKRFNTRGRDLFYGHKRNIILFTAKARTGSSRKPNFWEILDFSINLLKSRINQNRIKKVRGGRDSNPGSMVP